MSRSGGAKGENERRRRPGGGRMPAAAVKAQKSADTGGKRQVSALMAERVGFEPTCPCGQLDFECFTPNTL